MIDPQKVHNPATEKSVDEPSFHNISGYCFCALESPDKVRDELKTTLETLAVLGTVLIACEGINVALVGSATAITAAQRHFMEDERFSKIDFKLSLSTFSPFSKLKVKTRPEIITFGKTGIDPVKDEAERLSAIQLKEWLDKNKDFQLLDTRNNYEIESGTFEQAISLGIDNFRDLPDAIDTAIADGSLDPAKPVVTFCTGGVRCEKAAPWLSQHGFNEVYQVDGGILRYFENCGDAHWQGDCFVFDDRVEITPQLEQTGAVICRRCHKAVSQRHQQPPDFVENSHCPACVSTQDSLRPTPGTPCP